MGPRAENKALLISYKLILELTTRAVIEEGEQILREPSLDDILTFTCMGEGSPAPNITWLWNGEYIEPGLWKIEQETLSDTRTRFIIMGLIK